MLPWLRSTWRRDHALHLTGAQLALAAALSATVTLAAAPAPGPAPTAPIAAETAPAIPAALPTATADPVVRLQDLTPEAARRWNAANPIADLPNPAAKPFRLKAESVLDEARAIDCLTAAVYYEAAWESPEGQRAVAQVVLNRVRHPAFPKTVCGVVFQGSERRTGCQFTFTCDGALARTPNEAAWSRARRVATAALNGYVMRKVGNATHYHADYVAPYWSPNLVKVASVGAHVFYRWTGGWGLPPAFGGRYEGGERALEMAKLDGLTAGDEARLQLTAATVPAAPPVQAPAVEAAVLAPEVAPDADQPLVVAAEVGAADADALVRPETLDWAGRPKPREPVRIAVPSAWPSPGPGLSPY